MRDDEVASSGVNILAQLSAAVFSSKAMEFVTLF